MTDLDEAARFMLEEMCIRDRDQEDKVSSKINLMEL